MFTTVLVANRGEIARRVLRTCRRLGIRTVAVHSDADAGAPHVRDADVAVRLGPAPATDSYLAMDRVVAAALDTGAQAIHPGYGFLSENAAFAAAVRDAGLTFVGPDADTIALMGDKAAAKRQLAAAGVPVVPGIDDDRLDDEALLDVAGDVGFPLLVKAVAGGGGKGMRVVEDPSGLQDALAAARREAAGAFGDDRVILERYVHGPRHVEVQVLGDRHGHVIHVLERECSVQRRHQKVVEETPSPAVDDALRAAMGAAAVRAAEAVGYHNAGTVEFLLSAEREFFFLEMNTRLQVEHPVTELVTGIDLVEWQLRVAAGEPLTLRQQDVRPTGHALEVRLYAEDVAGGYLPQTGTVAVARFPDVAGSRIDSGVEDGSEVSRFYDPMLAKLVVHGTDRDTSRERMLRLLTGSVVLGVTTNLEFLADVVAHPTFASGQLTTAFLGEHFAQWTPEPLPRAALVAAALAGHRPGTEPDRSDPWSTIGPWRLAGTGGWRQRLVADGAEHVVDVARLATTPGDARGDRYVVSLDGDDVLVEVTATEGARRELVLDGAAPVATHAVVVGADVWVHADGRTRRVTVQPATRHADRARAAAGAAFTSPMPGAVVAVNVAAGEHVESGATLVVVEAMKMEHPVTAPVPGTVTALYVRAGDPVEGGAELLAFEPDEDQEATT